MTTSETMDVMDTTIIVSQLQFLQILGCIGAVTQGMKSEEDDTGEVHEELADLMALTEYLGNQYVLQHANTAVAMGEKETEEEQ